MDTLEEEVLRSDNILDIDERRSLNTDDSKNGDVANDDAKKDDGGKNIKKMTDKDGELEVNANLTCQLGTVFEIFDDSSCKGPLNVELTKKYQE